VTVPAQVERCAAVTPCDVVALTSSPSLRNSPSNFSDPTPGLSCATCKIHPSQSLSMGGRPGLRPGLNVHLRRTRSRCHPITVSGLNSRTLSVSLVRAWLAWSFTRTANTASGTFCHPGICGPRFGLRSTIRSCWRSSMISKSFSHPSSASLPPGPTRTPRQTSSDERTCRFTPFLANTKPHKHTALAGHFQPTPFIAPEPISLVD
jgi:hypothetical protein